MRNTAKKATVRLSDIAKETGYSLSTVSKALNAERRFRRDAANHQRGVETVWYSRKATSTKSQRIIEIVFQDLIMSGLLKCYAEPSAKPNNTI